MRIFGGILCGHDIHVWQILARYDLVLLWSEMVLIARRMRRCCMMSIVMVIGAFGFWAWDVVGAHHLVEVQHVLNALQQNALGASEQKGALSAENLAAEFKRLGAQWSAMQNVSGLGSADQTIIDVLRPFSRFMPASSASAAQITVQGLQPAFREAWNLLATMQQKLNLSDKQAFVNHLRNRALAAGKDNPLNHPLLPLLLKAFVETQGEIDGAALQKWLQPMVNQLNLEQMYKKRTPPNDDTEDKSVFEAKAKAIFGGLKFSVDDDFVVQLVRNMYVMVSNQAVRNPNLCKEQFFIKDAYMLNGLWSSIAQSATKTESKKTADVMGSVQTKLLPKLAGQIDQNSDSFLLRMCMTFRFQPAFDGESIVSMYKFTTGLVDVQNNANNFKAALCQWKDDRSLMSADGKVKGRKEALSKIDEQRCAALVLIAKDQNGVDIKTILGYLDAMYTRYGRLVREQPAFETQNALLEVNSPELQFCAAACADVWATLLYAKYGINNLNAFAIKANLQRKIEAYLKGKDDQTFFIQALSADSAFSLWQETAQNKVLLRYTAADFAEMLKAYVFPNKSKSPAKLPKK